MQRDQLNAWLNSGEREWSAGLALLSAFSAKRHLIRVLVTKGRTVRTAARLHYELSRIAKAKTDVAVVKPGKPGNPTRKSSTVLQTPGELDGDSYYQDLVARKNKFHRKAMQYRSTLLYLAQPGRGIAARNMLMAIRERDKLWTQIDYYEKFRVKAPVALSSSDPTILEARKKRDNLRSSVSKLKKKIADVTKVNSHERYRNQMAVKLIEITDLDQIINS